MSATLRPPSAKDWSWIRSTWLKSCTSYWSIKRHSELDDCWSHLVYEPIILEGLRSYHREWCHWRSYCLHSSLSWHCMRKHLRFDRWENNKQPVNCRPSVREHSPTGSGLLPFQHLQSLCVPSFAVDLQDVALRAPNLGFPTNGGTSSFMSLNIACHKIMKNCFPKKMLWPPGQYGKGNESEGCLEWRSGDGSPYKIGDFKKYEIDISGHSNGHFSSVTQALCVST